VQASNGPFALQKTSQTRQTATHEVHVNLGPLTARAAFSHVPFWQSVAAMVQRIVQRPTPGNPVAAPKATDYKEVLVLKPVNKTHVQHA
jgi:hypothetical protein